MELQIGSDFTFFMRLQVDENFIIFFMKYQISSSFIISINIVIQRTKWASIDKILFSEVETVKQLTVKG